MKVMKDRMNRNVTLTGLAAKQGYAQVLVPYSKRELATRKTGNIAVGHLQTMRLDRLTEIK